MSGTLENRLLGAAGPVLAARLRDTAGGLLQQRSGDDAARRLSEPILRGLGRAIVQPEAAAFLSHRPQLLERLAAADATALDARENTLLLGRDADPPQDLETALDALRLLRREETVFAACLDLAGLAPFDRISDFLSIVAEAIGEQALRLARRAAPDAPPFAVIGMGKIAGREFTYYSDLDLIFLYDGGPDAVDRASRIGQRMISYLATPTGAGVAYAVDTRLRPSGGQGMLVTSLAAFERYQCERAQTWEHLAMLRARGFAGAVEAGQRVLERVRERVLEDHPPPWKTLAEMRARVEAERSPPGDAVPLKTAPGCLMDVDFLAGGSLLERGVQAAFPELPSVPELLRASVQGERVESLLTDYRLLRVVEARARWLAGRAVEVVPADDELGVVAELVEPGLDAEGLRARCDAVRQRIRAAWQEVVAADSIECLGD